MVWWLTTVSPETSFAVPSFVELAAGATLAGVVGWLGHRRPALAASIGRRFRDPASHVRIYILAAAFLPVAVRLALLPWWPACCWRSR
jgi:hypothetical protein